MLFAVRPARVPAGCTPFTAAFTSCRLRVRVRVRVRFRVGSGSGEKLHTPELRHPRDVKALWGV